MVRYVIERDISAPAVRARLLSDAMSGNEEIREKLVERYCAFADIISEKISQRTDSVSADYLSWLILLASDGMFLQKTLKNESFDFEKLITQSIEYLKKMN